MDSIFDKFTSHSRNALKNAFGIALSSGNKFITPQHILYALSQQKGSIAAHILVKAKISPIDLKKNLNKSLSTSPITSIELSTGTKKVIEKSFMLAASNHHRYIGTEHLLASLLSVKDTAITDCLKEKNVSVKELQLQLESVLANTSKFPDITDSFSGAQDEKNSGLFGAMTQTKTNHSTLELFATDLTNSTTQTTIDPVIGRQEEIDRVIQILSRRNKNNPLLLGDPGVGKTAIIEGLAKKIVEGNVPEILRDKKIYALDLSLVVAGTSFRGEFENRLKQILNEIKRDPRIILFIDEIHNIIGIGSATGSMDAANILKPALARGEIRCIGATTNEEYKKYIESDAALERRFQPVYVNQPSVEKTIEILEGIKKNYEAFHQVRITSDAITAAAHLSDRYIADRFLPDKAIDVIDEAASAIKIQQLAHPLIKELRDLERELRIICQKKEEAVTNERLTTALKLRQRESELQSKISEVKTALTGQKHKIFMSITDKDVAAVVARMTGVPLAELIVEEKKYLLNLEKELSKKVIDQDRAIQSIAEFIRRSRTGITDANRPIGSFMFLGPSGVGKTELAKVLATTVFGSSQHLVKIDMSEFAESFNISKLIGAPAGYVGYKDATKLTDAIKRRPYSVVLFDEIEKAHRQIFHLLLQILEDGYLTDATGKKINFRNTIIIMTSNIGSEHFNRQAAIGFRADTDSKAEAAKKSFAETETIVLTQLKDKFPSEFLSRIDKLVVFKPLHDISIKKIAGLQLAELAHRVKANGITVTFEPGVVSYIAQKSYSPDIGARAIRKTIQDEIEGKIANRILKSKQRKGASITVKVVNNQLMI